LRSHHGASLQQIIAITRFEKSQGLSFFKPDQKTMRYRELDVLRGVAALMVVFFHFSWGFEAAGFVFGAGNTGVDLFFMISGFVIFLTLKKVGSAAEFAVNRFCRLYPVYWVCVTLSYSLNLLYFQFVQVDFNVFGFGDYLVNLTMLQYYFNVANVDQSYWTLIIELLFYLGMVILFLTKLIRRIALGSLAL
jgi:peptidoglycan/LPS O-acetylase OafA/YrhL